MPIFHSKHQKLVLQCYPPGKAIDKKPNPSELSYLLYYASTRRVKLEKVGSFLKRKTISDCNHNRSGNLIVTLLICSELMEKCSENLNAFAPYICSILNSILDTKDLLVCKVLLDTYRVFCNKLDETLFSGDKEFVDLFSTLSKKLISFGADKQRSGPNELDWLILSVKSCKYMTKCTGYDSKMNRKFINLFTPMLLNVVKDGVSEQGLINKLGTSINIEDNKTKLSKVTSRVSTVFNYASDDDGENHIVTKREVTEAAFNALRSLFHSSLTSQIVQATRTITSCLQKLDASPMWCSTFLDICVTWIPVQLRFLALSTLLTDLDSFSTNASAKSSCYAEQVSYGKYILGLVSRDVSMIGLSISDVTQKLLSLQTKLLLEQSSYLKREQVEELSDIFSNCICSLSTHIYYFDQVPDSIQSILIKINNVLEYYFFNTKIDKARLHELILIFIKDIETIFVWLKKRPSSINRSQVSLETWNLGLPLVCPQFSFGVLRADDNENSTPLLTPEQLIDIQLKFIKVFQTYLLDEIKPISDRELTSGENYSSIDYLLPETKNYLQPDFNDYISDEDNYITHLLIYVDQYLLDEKNIEIKVVLELIETLRVMISVLGINFVNNFIPFFFHWQLPSNSSEVKVSAKLRDTTAYILLYQSLIQMDDIYKLNYVRRSKLYHNMLGDINFRKLNALWYAELPSSTEAEAFSTDIVSSYDDLSRFNLSKKCFEEFTNGEEFVSRWLNLDRKLRLDMINGHRDYYKSKIDMDFNDADAQGTTSSESEVDIDEAGSTIGKLNGLGLGNANDISSIQSGILLSHNHGSTRNGYDGDTPNASLYTIEGRSHFAPRVSELKDNYLNRKPSALGMNDPNSSSTTFPSSVLSKQMAHSEIKSILENLDDDDSNIVV